MDKKIVLIDKGNRCPKCYGNGAFKRMVFASGYHTFLIDAYKCKCGCVFISKKHYNRQKDVILRRYLDTQFGQKSAGSEMIEETCHCIMCGRKKRFPGSDMCFECLKYEREQMLGH